jgi:polyhydroxyalkanoate synthesis regulator phasin
MNVPSTADVESLREKIDDLERLLAQLEGKVDKLLEPPR